MRNEHIWILSLDQHEQEQLNEKRCPKCGGEVEVVKLGGVPQVWNCETCHIEYSTAS